MSTRCQVRIIKNGYPLNLYHHCDGYFTGVGSELHDALKIGMDNLAGIPGLGGADPHDKERYERAFYSVMRLLKDDKSYEPTFYQHFDIEYFYLLDFDENVFVGWQTPCMRAWEGLPDDEGKWYERMPNIKDGHVKINLLDEILDDYDN